MSDYDDGWNEGHDMGSRKAAELAANCEKLDEAIEVAARMAQVKQAADHAPRLGAEGRGYS